MLGYKFKQDYKKQVKQSLLDKQKQKETRKRKKEEEQYYGDDIFHFIAGYTSNGVPYGITHEEMKDLEKESTANLKERVVKNIENDDLPF